MCVCVCVCVYVFMCLCVCVSVCLDRCVGLFMCVPVRLYVLRVWLWVGLLGYVCVCVCVCVCGVSVGRLAGRAIGWHGGVYVGRFPDARHAPPD